jgi:hypothetical protein
MKVIGLLLMVALSGCRLPPPRGASPPRACASLPYNVTFILTAENLQPHDAISIRGVRGDRPTIAPGGLYCVWGHYWLNSRADATLCMSSGDGETRCFPTHCKDAFVFRFSMKGAAARQRISLRGTDGRDFGWVEFSPAEK